MNLRKSITKLCNFLLFFAVSCSSDDNGDPRGCPEVTNYGNMVIEAPDMPYAYNNFTYSYMDREGIDSEGNFVYQFIYSNYDVENATTVEDGYFLKFRIKTPNDFPEGTFSLTDSDKTISDVETFYDYSTGKTVGFVDVTSMTVTFSDFDSCLNHNVIIYFSDNEFLLSTIGNGSFNGVSKLYTIE